MSQEGSTGVMRRSKLTFVDLAGSECIGLSQVSGEAAKEASHINKSLSALSDVLLALGEKREHIPYRNSKLTFLLRDSIGKNAKKKEKKNFFFCRNLTNIKKKIRRRCQNAFAPLCLTSRFASYRDQSIASIWTACLVHPASTGNDARTHNLFIRVQGHLGAGDSNIHASSSLSSHLDGYPDPERKRCCGHNPDVQDAWYKVEHKSSPISP